MLKRTRKIVVATGFIIIVAILISIAFFVNQTTPFGTPPFYQIVDGNFTINANSYKAYNFTTPTDISKCQVSGSFNVYGAISGKIRVYIWDNVAFANWQSGQVSQSPLGRVTSFYDSGFTTNGLIDASPYPGGTYFLVFQNNSTEPQNVTSQTHFWYISK
jgi:hypothetical protein